MPPEAGIFIFITIMTALSIPIIAIIKGGKNKKIDHERIEQLEKRVRELEMKQIESSSEMNELKHELKYTTKLIEK